MRRRFRGRRRYRRRRRSTSRRIVSRGLRRRQPVPEIKWVDIRTPNAITAGAWSQRAISPVTWTKGTGVSQVLGNEIRTRYATFRFQCHGATSASTNKTAPDGILRVMLFTTEDTDATATAYFGTLTNLDDFVDYNQIHVLKDLKISLGNSAATDLSVPFTKLFRISIPFVRNMRLTNGGTVVKQRDVIRMATYAYYNDADIECNCRVTYMDA